MGDWNRSLLLVVLWSWRILRELKVQNCWFIYLLCEQEANKLREIQKIQVIARVCERLCYVSKRNSSDGVHGMARSRMSSFGGGHGLMELWSPVSVTTRTDSKRNLVMPMIWGALLFDCLRCILVFLIFIVLGLNIAPIFKRTPVWFFKKISVQETIFVSFWI